MSVQCGWLGVAEGPAWAFADPPDASSLGFFFRTPLPNICSARPPSPSMNHAGATTTSAMPWPSAAWRLPWQQTQTRTQQSRRRGRPSGCHPSPCNKRRSVSQARARPRPQTPRQQMKTCRGCWVMEHKCLFIHLLNLVWWEGLTL